MTDVKKKKQLMLNITYVCCIHFSIIFLIKTYINCKFYYSCDVELLIKELSLLNLFLRIVLSSLLYCILPSAASVLVLIALRHAKIKNHRKIIIAWCISFLTFFVWTVQNMGFSI